MFHPDSILVLDFGSQYTQLIARRIRELHVYCEIHPFSHAKEAIEAFCPKGIILSGGPASVTSSGAPMIGKDLLDGAIPVLGICYGMQLVTRVLGGQVGPAVKKEYGRAMIEADTSSLLFSGLETKQTVWMSHGDRIEVPPGGFVPIACSDNSPYAALANPELDCYIVQFHPEVVHTAHGMEILKNFVMLICHCEATWTMRSYVEQATKDITSKVGSANVVCGASGGVDSTVVAALLHRAIGDQLHCIFVDNGLLRKDEARVVVERFTKHLGINLHAVDARERFLEKLKGITDPEAKRKIIGEEFIAVFEEEASKIANVKFLAQGTLYPDVIESVSVKGPSATIKSHHNVGGLPEAMKLDLVEPLRELFKDEVRELGKELGLALEVINRQPFPGPGLAVRILGEINPERLSVLQEADMIVIEEFKRAGLYEKVWQSFAVLLPIQTVGVMGDERTYENVVALRVVNSQDGMTADWVPVPYDLLGRISNRIINEVRGVNRVVYDISSKPPSTIEWE